ncbi:hypothetical protein GGI13_008204 [Coemansia sp. RSA 455]|nr:hypothetical protein GGI13_008204 [Coemansia sp. RSA 455]
MFANAISSVSLLAFALLATTTKAHPQPHVHAHASGVFVKRWDGYGAYGGYGTYGRFGFPNVVSVTNDVNRNSNRANFNENTLYANNVNANAASDNVHAFTNANVIA